MCQGELNENKHFHHQRMLELINQICVSVISEGKVTHQHYCNFYNGFFILRGNAIQLIASFSIQGFIFLAKHKLRFIV